MYPYVNFLGSRIPTYSLCAMLGLLASTFVLVVALYSKGLVRKYAVLAYIALPGVILGGKFFSAISITLTEFNSGKSIDMVENVRQAGNVYYGGLLGYLVLIYLLCKLRNLDFRELESPIAISIPLFHSFGRVGCFFAGCCYGIESDSWFAVPYRINGDTDAVRRIPVQLIEAGFELCLCGLLCMLFWNAKKCEHKDQHILEIYLISYGLFRLVIEFLRGDMVRGVYQFLSFSQIVSLMLLLGVVCHRFYHVLIKKK